MTTELSIKFTAESGLQALFARKLARKWAFFGMFQLNYRNFSGTLAQ